MSEEPSSISVDTKHPSPIYRCMTKGVRGAPDKFQYGLDWMAARRGILMVFGDRMECGNWIIPYRDIQDAELFQTRSGLIPCFILRVRTLDSAWQFGLNGNKFWEGDLPFPVIRSKGRLKHSIFSIALRLLLFAGLVWYLFFRNS